MVEEVEAPVDPQAALEQLGGRIARWENFIRGRHVWVVELVRACHGEKGTLMLVLLTVQDCGSRWGNQGLPEARAEIGLPKAGSTE